MQAKALGQAIEASTRSIAELVFGQMRDGMPGVLRSWISANRVSVCHARVSELAEAEVHTALEHMDTAVVQLALVL